MRQIFDLANKVLILNSEFLILNRNKGQKVFMINEGGERGKRCHSVEFAESKSDPNESTETSGERAPSASSDD